MNCCCDSSITHHVTYTKYEARCRIPQIFEDVLAQNVDATVIRVYINLPFHWQHIETSSHRFLNTNKSRQPCQKLEMLPGWRIRCVNYYYFIPVVHCAWWSYTLDYHAGQARHSIRSSTSGYLSSETHSYSQGIRRLRRALCGKIGRVYSHP